MELYNLDNTAPLLGAVVALVGAALVVVSADHVLVEHRDPVAIVLGGVLPTIIAAGVVAGGGYLARSGLSSRHAVRVAGWWLLGIGVAATMGLAAIVYSQSHGVVVVDALYVITNNATVGAAGGLVVGLYDARSRRRSEALATERERLEILNRVLRHDIRNDLNVVLLSAGMIDERVDEETRPYLRKLQRAANEAVDLTDETKAFLEAIGRDDARELRAVDLGAVVDEQVEVAREKYPHAVLRRGQMPDVKVFADDLLPAVVRNLVGNAIQHTDSETPHVDVEADATDGSVVLRVADDGPGIPDDRKDEVFGRGERGLRSEGGGIGLYLVDTLVGDYGGDVWIEDRQPTGAVFAVELQRAGEASSDPRPGGDGPTSAEERAAV